MNIYETPKLLCEYLLFHYGKDEEIMPWPSGPRDGMGFPQRSVSDLIDPSLLTENTRALDLGCAVGRSCYELALYAKEVLGIDYSQSFVDAADEIRIEGELPYLRIDEGQTGQMLKALRPEQGKASRIRFEQGDAMNLRSGMCPFEVVHAANLLCRLTEPKLLLKRLPDLVKPGGQLLLTTPCTWLDTYTPLEHQPLGSTFEWLQSELTPHFELVLQKDLPFLIREHARKFQWSMALGTRWVRR
jgi:putative 4-mercaptohistidine N1-methyltranferase